MSNRERIFHALLFECLAIILTLLLTWLLTDHSLSALFSTIVLISFIAMCWNVVFNKLFDRFFTGRRVERSWRVRCFHTLCFELGLLVFTLPLVAAILAISWWDAFVMDMGMTLFIMTYTLVFNWCYDHLRERFLPD